MRRTLSVAVAVALVAAAVAPGVAAATPSTVTWGACPADVAAPGLECSTVEVPLDYRQPAGRQIEIAISRLASKNPAERRGVLLFNQGGPGLQGLSLPTYYADTLRLPQGVQDAYDLIGFDPRGVGHSAPVTCDETTEQLALGGFPPYAYTAADVTKAAVDAKTVARQCAMSKTGSMLPYITTANTARDMDRIRAALGEPKISYYGDSYGTYLGSVYTTLFPERSDRIVLDSSLGPNGYDDTALRMFALGTEQRFPDFATFAAGHPGYGLGSTPDQVTAKYFELATRLDKTPAQGYDGSLFRVVTNAYLRNTGSFGPLAVIWQSLDTNQPSPGVARAQDGDNLTASHFYVVCGDTQWPRSIQTYQRNVAVDRARYPLLGAASANIVPCAFWPINPIEPPVRIGDRGPSDVLMMQNLRDPATPLVGAQQLRQTLGDRARMVTVDQGGHGVYLVTANKCANDTVTTFLTTGKRPARDAFCADQPS